MTIFKNCFTYRWTLNKLLIKEDDNIIYKGAQQIRHSVKKGKYNIKKMTFQFELRGFQINTNQWNDSNHMTITGISCG